jgi:hypothetical protein
MITRLQFKKWIILVFALASCIQPLGSAAEPDATESQSVLSRSRNKLERGSAEGTFRYIYVTRIRWSGEALFPVAISIRHLNKEVARTVVDKDEPVRLEADLHPGTFQVYSEVLDKEAKEVYWNAFGPRIHVNQFGVSISEQVHDIRHDKKMKLLCPKAMELLDTRRPTLRWQPIRDAEYYSITWFEMSWPDRKVISTKQGVRSDTAGYQFETDLVDVRLYEWDVNACDAQGEQIAHSNDYFLTIGADPRARPKIAEQVDSQGGFLGLALEQYEPAIAELFGLDAHDVVVETVLADSPAIRAGFRPKDIILRYDGTDFQDRGALIRLIRNTKPGVKVQIQIRRDGKEHAVEVTIGSAAEAFRR